MCFCVEIGVREKKRKETIESRRFRWDWEGGRLVRQQKRRKRGKVQFGGTRRLRERFVYLEEWLETRARPSHPPIGRFLLVKYKPRAEAWCNELNQREGLILRLSCAFQV